MHKAEQGFTAIEISIVMVIIGMLLSGALKGAELISNSHTRNLIAQQDALRTAFLGFQDRFRALPGDYRGTDAARTIQGVSADLGGNGDGVLENMSAHEQTIAWTHLSKAGFLAADYTMHGATEPVSSSNTPRNIFNAFVQIAQDDNFASSGATTRMNIKTGNLIPVEILSEIDRKIDDGNAIKGDFRYSAYNGAAASPEQNLCFTAGTGNWNINSTSDNCGGASIF